MKKYSSSAIIHTQLLPHEESNFSKLFIRLKKLVSNDKELSKLFWTKNDTSSGVVLKVYSKDKIFMENKLLERFLDIVNSHFAIKPSVILNSK